MSQTDAPWLTVLGLRWRGAAPVIAGAVGDEPEEGETERR